MAKYVYPAIFTKEDNGQYSVNFPDFESCYTGGDNLQEAFEMANDVLCLTLYDKEKAGEAVPTLSDPKTIVVQENTFVSLVACDTLEYQKFYDNKAVKKTLTIPSWLNTRAERANAPFSQILQQGLKNYLSIAE